MKLANPFGLAANYLVFKSGIEGMHPRAGLAISKGVNATIVPQLCTSLCTPLVSVDLPLIKTFWVVSIYLHGKEAIDLINLNKIREYSLRHRYLFIPEWKSRCYNLV